jgi:TolB-like protein
MTQHREQLERILSSQALSGSDQLKRLLRLIVERTADGRPDSLKEYNLGLDVFQRPPDYDPKIDPIVRVQARRLRAKLEEYYAGEGAHDPLIIRIPKGAYVPVFQTRTASSSSPHASNVSRRVGLAAAGLVIVLAVPIALWLTRTSLPASADRERSVTVLPLKNFSNANSQSHIADQAAEILTTELAAKGKGLRVLSRTTASRYRDTASSLPQIAKELGVRWVVEGGVGTEGTRAYLKLRAVDSLTDRKIWADVFDCELSEMVGANRRAAEGIAAAIESELRTAQR